jgi:prephenate dehydratase
MSKPLPKKTLIGTLGPAFSFHDILHRKELSEYPLQYFESFDDIFLALKRREIGAAIIAVKNTIHGAIQDNSNAIATYDLKIVNEFELPIMFYLAAKNKVPLDSITTIYAHEIAWSECLVFLESLKVNHISSRSNSQALIDLLDDSSEFSAGIAGKEAIEHYGLETISENIDTSSINITTFALIINNENNLH